MSANEQPRAWFANYQAVFRFPGASGHAPGYERLYVNVAANNEFFCIYLGIRLASSKTALDLY